MNQDAVSFTGSHAQIRIPEHFKKTDADEVLQWITTLTSAGVSKINFDFSMCRIVEVSIYPIMGQIKSELQRQHLEYWSIGIRPTVAARLINDGVKGLFNIKEKTSENARPSAQNRLLKPENVQALVNAVLAVFREQSIEVQAGKASVMETSLVKDQGVLGVMPLAGEGLKGMIRLCFPDAIAVGLHRLRTGEELPAASEECLMMVERMSDLCFEKYQEGLLKNGVELKGAFPSTFVGKLSGMRSPPGVSILVIPIQTPYGEVTVELSLG